MLPLWFLEHADRCTRIEDGSDWTWRASFGSHGILAKPCMSLMLNMPLLLQSSFVPDSLSISIHGRRNIMAQQLFINNSVCSIHFPPVSNGILMNDRPALSRESIMCWGGNCCSKSWANIRKEDGEFDLIPPSLTCPFQAPARAESRRL